MLAVMMPFGIKNGVHLIYIFDHRLKMMKAFGSVQCNLVYMFWTLDLPLNIKLYTLSFRLFGSLLRFGKNDSLEAYEAYEAYEPYPEAITNTNASEASVVTTHRKW